MARKRKREARGKVVFIPRASLSCYGELLTAAVMTEMIEQSKVIGQDEALENFRRWIQQHTP